MIDFGSFSLGMATGFLAGLVLAGQIARGGHGGGGYRGLFRGQPRPPRGGSGIIPPTGPQPGESPSVPARRPPRGASPSVPVEKTEAARALIELGLEVRAGEVRKAAGFNKPDRGEETPPVPA